MKRILCVLSECGFWGEELVEPLELFDKRGYETVIATPRGNMPAVIPVSMDPNFIDPAQNKPVVTEEVATKVKMVIKSGRLDNPLDLSMIMPGSPYFSAENYCVTLEDYYTKLDIVEKKLDEEYDALLLVGGSGPIIDMANSQRIHDLILAFYKKNKPVAAECYATAALIFARDSRLKQCILKGRHVTGHPIDFDYKDNYGFVGVTGAIHEVLYPLEYMLRDAVGPDGEFIGNVGNKTSVVVDYPIITSRSTYSSRLCGEKLIECLENGLKRFGW